MRTISIPRALTVMVLTAMVLLIISACGGEDPFNEEASEIDGEIERSTMATYSSVKRLYSIQRSKCAYNATSKVTLKACGTSSRQKVTVVSNTNKCAHYTYYRVGSYSYPVCTGFAFQMKMGSKCIRPVDPYHNVKVALGSCSGDKAWWGTYSKRIFNYAKRKVYLSNSNGVVITKKPNNAYDQNDTKYKFID